MAIYELSKNAMAQRKNEVRLKLERTQTESELSRLLAENPQLVSDSNMFENDLINIRNSLLERRGVQRYSINDYWAKGKIGEFLDTCQLLDMPSPNEKRNLYESPARTKQRTAIRLITRGSMAYKLGKDVTLMTKTGFTASLCTGAIPILAMDTLMGLGCYGLDSVREIAARMCITSLFSFPIFTGMSYMTLRNPDVDDPLAYISGEIKERAKLVSEYDK